MVEIVRLDSLPKEVKISILNEIGYASDGFFVLDSKGNKVLDKYIQKEIKIDNMLILPGSTIVLDNNPVSVASYIEEFGDVF